MDPSVVIVHRSDTRRKACTGCVKAKRRCDLTLPACSRCMKRNIDCNYGDSGIAIVEQAVVSSLELDAAPIRPVIPFTPPPEPTVELEYENFFSSPYASFPFPHLVAADPFQVDYCISELQRSVETLVLEGRTPFIHPDLYSEAMPEVYQDLIGICSFYMQRAPQNYSVVFRMMDARLKKLGESAKSVVQLAEWLLHVQALIMYQIIRLFDGNIIQRGNAEIDMKVLDAWTERLQAEFSEADLAHVEPTRNWIMMESIRRTVMVSWLLRGIYKAVIEGVCDIVPVLTRLLVSENAEAWDGTSPVVENQNLITYPDYVERWNIGKITTVNLYEMLLLRACSDAIIEGISRWGQLESRSRIVDI
ncbi:hypothetical protein BKA65DRAFT_170434 [Rhexocercosporidium sp. MPI-PUGE-AT-0058]|nr:hypothetical protein BKA65DRAFT_170434 [Rhexocercosporidium sp. MPI-PUGE-AT-0058]